MAQNKKKRSGRRRFGNVRRRASGRWQARYVGPDGIERTAPHTFGTEPQAEKWLTLVESDILKGEWAPPEAGEVLLGDYAERWLKERSLAPRTREIYESLYKLNIRPYLSDVALGAIKPATIRAWRKRLLDDRRPEYQAVKAYRLLRAILSTAVDEDEILKLNPCRVKGFDSFRAPERPVATVEQVLKLADEMPARFHALIMMAGFCGLRWGELAALRRCDLDLKAGTVRVARNLVELRDRLIFAAPKSEAGKRTVAIPEIALGSLRVHLELNVGSGPEAMVFTGDKGALLRAANFRRAVDWSQSCQNVGMPDGFHFHDLRHLANMLAARAGANAKELMHRLGQSTERAAMIYLHATRERDFEIAREIDRRLRMASESTHGVADDDDGDDGAAGVLARVG